MYTGLETPFKNFGQGVLRAWAGLFLQLVSELALSLWWCFPAHLSCHGNGEVECVGRSGSGVIAGVRDSVIHISTDVCSINRPLH